MTFWESEDILATPHFLRQLLNRQMWLRRRVQVGVKFSVRHLVVMSGERTISFNVFTKIAVQVYVC